jgi:hypothetical protein
MSGAIDATSSRGRTFADEGRFLTRRPALRIAVRA